MFRLNLSAFNALFLCPKELVFPKIEPSLLDRRLVDEMSVSAALKPLGRNSQPDRAVNCAQTPCRTGGLVIRDCYVPPSREVQTVFYHNRKRLW